MGAPCYTLTRNAGHFRTRAMVRFSSVRRTAYRLSTAQAFSEHLHHDQTLLKVRITFGSSSGRSQFHAPATPICNKTHFRSTRCVPSNVGAQPPVGRPEAVAR